MILNLEFVMDHGMMGGVGLMIENYWQRQDDFCKKIVCFVWNLHVLLCIGLLNELGCMGLQKD